MTVTRDGFGAQLRLADILEKEVVGLEDERLDVGDLIMLGVMTGVWQRFEHDVARGLALELGGAGVDRDQISARATAFRHRRRLLSAAEFTAWLRAQSLTIGDLSGVLGRQLLREGSPDDELEPAVSAEQLAEILYPEVMCSDVLDELATAGAQRLAAAHRSGSFPLDFGGEASRVGALVTAAGDHPATGLPALGESELERRARRLLALEDALGRTRAELARDERSIQQRLSDHGLDWLRCSGEELVLGLAGAARESQLLLAEDRLSLQEVAARAGAEIRQQAFMLEDLPRAARAELESLRPGEVAEPWQTDGGDWHVFELQDKVSPSLEDPELRERLIDELVRDTLSRYAAGRVERFDAA